MNSNDFAFGAPDAPTSEQESEAAEANGRNWYFEGQHGAEEPADTAARLDLVQERDALNLMVTWAYGKLHSRTFNSMEDALELDRIKLYVEHGIRA